jgi:uncharacterized membrane protein
MTILTALFPVALVGLLTCLLPALVAPTLPFGVRIPPQRVDEPAVRQQRRAYFWRTGVIAVAATVVAAFVPPLVAAPLALVPLAAALICYALARRAIRSAKAAGDWYAGLTQAVATDTTWRSEPPAFPWLWTLPALAILIATAVTGAVRYPNLPGRLAVHIGANGVADRFADKSIPTAFTLVFLQLFVTVLVLALLGVTYRSRPETDAADPAGSIDRYRRFLAALAPAMLMLVALVNASLLVGSLRIWEIVAATSASVGLTAGLPLLGIALLIVQMVRVGQAGARLRTPAPATPTGGVVNRDDDANWVGGLLYMNREDPAILVARRFGVGWTLNLGHPLSWLVLLATVAIVVVLVVIRRH